MFWNQNTNRLLIIAIYDFHEQFTISFQFQKKSCIFLFYIENIGLEPSLVFEVLKRSYTLRSTFELYIFTAANQSRLARVKVGESKKINKLALSSFKLNLCRNLRSCRKVRQWTRWAVSNFVRLCLIEQSILQNFPITLTKAMTDASIVAYLIL